MKKIVITSCDENDDYLQLWDLFKLYWVKMGWYVKFYFIGSKSKYLTLNQDEENVEIVHISPLKNINTAFMAQMFCTYGVVLEKDNTICYWSGFDTILIRKFKFLDDKNIELAKNNIINSCITLGWWQGHGYSSKVSGDSYMGMHFLGNSSLFKKLYYDIGSGDIEHLISFIKSSYPQNYQIRGHGWGTDQEILNKYIKNWIANNNILIKKSMKDSNEGWLNRMASIPKPTYNLRDSVTGNIINTNVVEYIKQNKHIIWFHPYLGHLFKDKNQANNKLYKEIIIPLIDYLKNDN
jgi:hypothetical protein